MKYLFGLGFLSPGGIELWLVSQMSPEGRKNVECINCTSDFPYDVVFFSRDLGGGALGACHCDFFSFSFHPADFGMCSLFLFSLFTHRLQGTLNPRAKWIK